jgi:hypothetical protein
MQQPDDSEKTESGAAGPAQRTGASLSAGSIRSGELNAVRRRHRLVKRYLGELGVSRR